MFINVLYIIYIYNILEEKKKRFKYYYFISYICIYHFDFFRVYFILERKLSDKITFEILIKMLTK